MSDRLRPLPLDRLAGWMADELAARDSLFGIPRRLFFVPRPDHRFRSVLGGRLLEAPVGVAAGPHSQLAQNIVAAWLCGARFIELKTVQTRDRLSIPRPCIHMPDEGYNVEWSQELSVEESFRQYLHAWVLVHALHAHLGFPGDAPGVAFNVSVGYDLQGLQQPNMQWFLDRVEDAGSELDEIVRTVSRFFPEVGGTEVPRRLAQCATLSTMHGCPPDEIAGICAFLLRERGLHTTVKLNPTLLGAEAVREILHSRLGWVEIEVDEDAFRGDLAYREALDLVTATRSESRRSGRRFGLKLTNTLAVVNPRTFLDPAEPAAYLSGRPLHALAVALAHRLSADLVEPPPMSFAGGADAGNIAPLFRCGFETVTACTDLLKPGGFLRLLQYLENLETAMAAVGAASLEAFARTGSPPGVPTTAHANLQRYAEQVLRDPALHASSYQRRRTKTRRGLGLFDCISAPCRDACGVGQQVPEYMRRVRLGDLAGAAAVTREDNPLAAILGRACHHPCELVCLRTHMDRPLAIREIKRLITDHEQPLPGQRRPARRGSRVAVIGAGPCGLAAAWFLARAGRAVTVFEARERSGGMVSATIPAYRAAEDAVERDLRRIGAAGIEVRHGCEIGAEVTLESLRGEGFGPVVIAVGAQRGRSLGIPGEGCRGVHEGLALLRAAHRGAAPALGRRVAVVGGGDVAVDCARTALRLGAEEVFVLYRRSRAEMPAQDEEVRDLLLEGGRLVELVQPLRLETTDGHLRAVVLAQVRLAGRDASGRPRPEIVRGSEEALELDALVTAVGQQPDLTVLGGATIATTPAGYLAVDAATLETSIPGVFAGGDVAGRGPATIVEAAGDGRRIAETILAAENVETTTLRAPGAWPAFDRIDLMRRRARSEPRVETSTLPVAQRHGFAEVLGTLTAEEGAAEAWRCLDCDHLCSTCEGVCPNRAIVTYGARPARLVVPGLRLDAHGVSEGAPTVVEIRQGPQVAVLADWCNRCGNCVTFCPTRGRPWHDKPRLFWNRADFDAERDNAFMPVARGARRGLHARVHGELLELWLGRQLSFLSPHLALSLDPGSLALRSADVAPSAPRGELVEGAALAAMVALLRALRESMPDLPHVDLEHMQSGLD